MAKSCTGCTEIKSDADFNKNQRWCRACEKAYYQKNKEKVSLRNKKYRLKNKEVIDKRVRVWHEKNPEKVNLYKRSYRKENPGKINALTAKRRAQKLQATPPWTNKQDLLQIQEFYTEAKELQWLSEEPLHVDHIVPLQGKEVCGLHVYWNLQILPASENINKRDKLLEKEI